jgi:hypothetical protein
MAVADLRCGMEATRVVRHSPILRRPRSGRGETTRAPEVQSHGGAPRTLPFTPDHRCYPKAEHTLTPQDPRLNSFTPHTAHPAAEASHAPKADSAAPTARATFAAIPTLAIATPKTTASSIQQPLNLRAGSS